MRLCPECGARYAPSAATCARDGAALVDTSRDPLLGATIGEYQTLELVGSGGMAQVYRARHVTTGRRFAVKVLVGAAAEDQTSRERFVREAKAIQQISHPNVVGLVDWGTTPGGRRFLVLEWVDGRELEDAIREEAPFGPVRAARIARQVAEGLAAIHATGFVHRDVKPHNVMLFERGGVESLKIVDFGLVYADSRLWDRLTRMGDIVGTPFYMAPETIEGRDADERTDLYSLGVMIHEMIAGEVPFNSPAIPEILARHLREPPPLLPDCGGLETLVYELLAKSPDDRPRSAAEVVERLDALDLTMSMTAPERAPSFMTMVTQPGSPRPSIDTAIGEVRAPLTATIVAPSKVPREPTPIAQTQPSIVPPGAIVDSVEGTSDARDPETTDDTRDTTQHDVPEPFEAATFVAMRARPVSDLLELDVGPDTPQLPLPVLSTLPAPPPPPKVIVGPAADRDLDDTAVHDAGELPEETLPMASGTPATRTLPSAAPAREPLVVRDVVVRETVRELPTTRETARDPARADAVRVEPVRDGRPDAVRVEPVRDGRAEGVRIEIHRPEPIREHLREQARAEPVRVDPPRGDRADRDAPKISIETGSNTTNVMIAIVVLLVVAGAGLGYLVLARTREPLVVPVRLPAEQPRAIARAPGPNEAALTALTSELEVAADAAGYGLDELGEAGPAAALANDWQSAREAGDLDAAKSAHAKLVEVLKSLRPDAAHLRKKCSALTVEIEALRGHLPDAKHQQLGDRARDLSTRAASATKPAELRELARTARTLRRELGEALRAR